MRKTPSNYVQDIERNGRTVSVIRAFGGSDYLEKWAETAEAEEVRLAQPQIGESEDNELGSKPTKNASRQADTMAGSAEKNAPTKDQV